MSMDESSTSRVERRSLKRSRQRTSSSQTDEDLISEDCSHHGCSLCNTKLQQIEEKLDKVLLLLPEFEQQKKKIAQVVNERVLLGGDFNCALSDLDKRGRRSFESKKAVIKEINEMKNTFDLVDMWRSRHRLDMWRSRLVDIGKKKKRSEVQAFGSLITHYLQIKNI